MFIPLPVPQRRGLVRRADERGLSEKVSLELFRYLRGTESPLEEGVLLLHFFHHEALDDVAFLDVIVILNAHAALVRGGNFLDIILESLE